MTKQNEQTARAGGATSKALLIALLAAAALIRVWILPAPNEVRDGDEIGYLTDGLMAWEGLSPGWESTPSGPQTWISYTYVGVRTGWEYLHTERKASTPGRLKPLFAVDDALFKTYEDLGPLKRLTLWISIVIAVAGVYGGYRLGVKHGGAAGGLLTGGLVALLPLFVEYAGISKSCSDAWMFAILAVSCAATLSGAKRCWWAGIMLGLALGSRIDMVMIAPLVLWGLWDSHEKGSLWLNMLGTMALSLAAALLSAPFAMQGFLGMLRNLALSGGSGYWGAEPQRLKTLTEVVWDQGLAPVLAVSLIGMFFLFRGNGRFKRVALAAFTLFMLAVIFLRHYQPVRYNAAVLISVVIFAAVASGAIFRSWPRPAVVLASALLALPAIQSLRFVVTTKAHYVPDHSTEWVDAHIPPGTPVYLLAQYTPRAVLPTESAADGIWAMVTGNEAWRTKLAEGFHRFSAGEGRVPRGLSEDNLTKDRGVCRRWFILGGGQSTRPRFDVRLLGMSRAFGLQPETLGPEFQRTGGVVIWPTRIRFIPSELGEPLTKWVNSTGNGVLVFVSPDLRKQIGQ